MGIELVDKVDVTLINAAASDDMVAMSAWVSFDMDSEERLGDTVRRDKLIDFLYRSKHMSPFEHGLFTFKVDVPLFVAREFMRHRTASYNEVSGRYTEMKPRFYVSDVARIQKGKPGDYYFEDGEAEQTAIYVQTKRKAVKKAWATYQQRLEAGIAKEQAREELPLSLMTQFYVTMNPRNLMQFLTLRNDKHALKEIRDVAVQMEEIFAQHMPVTYASYVKERTAREENSAANVNALKQQIATLTHELGRANANLTNAQSQRTYYKERAEKFEADFDELLSRYNRQFVAAKEAEKNADYHIGPDFDAKFEEIKARVDEKLGVPQPKLGAEIDYEVELKQGGLDTSAVDITAILHKGEKVLTQAISSAVPIFNIYNKNGDAAEIARTVIDSINKYEQRKKHR
jgi:thymidylate synthase (FAD)